MTETETHTDGASAPSAPRCGFVAILGAPNAGKSTLLNRLVGGKVAIVSPKVQTTRTRVLGIAMRGVSQIVLVDTPGIFAPRRRLDRAMVKAAWAGAADADLVLLLVDATSVLRKGDLDREVASILDQLAANGRPALLALNKIDSLPKEQLLERAGLLNARFTFQRVFMISALTGDGVEDLAGHLAAEVPAGPWLYPEDQLADMPERLLAAEVTREKAFLKLQQELPYSITVETESWTERPDGSARVDQVLYVQRDSQKAIVLGAGGSRIKELGSLARAELEQMLGRRIHLFLHVKVREGWIDDPERFRAIGLDWSD